jgi:hypothetical protein
MAVLDDDVLVFLASKLRDPISVLDMALVCQGWYDALERDRTRLVALAFEIEPWSRCSGSCSLADALDRWHDRFTKPDRLRHVIPGTTTPLELQLAILACDDRVAPMPPLREKIGRFVPPSMCWDMNTDRRTKHEEAIQDAMVIEKMHQSDIPHRIARWDLAHVLADGLVTHATLFSNVLEPTFKLMWHQCQMLGRGSCLYVALASPLDSIPVEILARTFEEDFSGPRLANLLSDLFEPIVESWTDVELLERLAIVLTRLAHFWSVTPLKKRLQSLEHFFEHPLRRFYNKWQQRSQLLRDAPAIEEAWDVCLKLFTREEGYQIPFDHMIPYPLPLFRGYNPMLQHYKRAPGFPRIYGNGPGKSRAIRSSGVVVPRINVAEPTLQQIDFVVEQCQDVTRDQAIAALKRNNNDIVDAIMDLSTADPEETYGEMGTID